MKLQKLDRFLKERRIRKSRFAEVLEVHPSKISYWLKHDFYVATDEDGYHTIVKRYAKFRDLKERYQSIWGTDIEIPWRDSF